ncbi:MAG: signal peptidase I [Candidatus Sungbacteria bacterium]|uniref:Signal peptidase I n=1 Tax=Candidatus Sungiibacteriota bacterium TaxID=2750080 RepID=A0A932YWG4_9BACT|nr:signal peptidase I [Candidatus Sungbacteria bacterium]
MRSETPASSEPAPAPPRFSVLRSIGDFLRLALIAAAIALPVRYFVAQPFIVRGASMEPNFYDREYLVVDELSYFFRTPERGEVVVFRYPLNPREYFIKRIVGLPGETVEIRDGAVFVANAAHPDGVRIEESYLPSDLERQGNARFTLGPNEYVVLGDNRPFSSDSRNWGAMDRKFITGRVVFRAWPIARAGVLRTP